MAKLSQSGTCRFLGLVVAACLTILRAQEAPKESSIPIAPIQRDTTVDFESEILPIFKNNCLACHGQTKPKASLVLETPQTIRQGGDSGAAVVPGNAQESLLLKVAAHQTDPVMPPRNNKVAASNLTSQELGLLKLWINQGAEGVVRRAQPIEWKPLPQGVNPIYSVAITRDGQFAACGRGNQIFLYHLPTRQLVGQLTDPALVQSGIYQSSGIAHRDMVHSLAFHPNGSLLASGDYRQVKLWSRSPGAPKQKLPPNQSGTVDVIAVTPDGQWLAAGHPDGRISLVALADGQVKNLDPHAGSVASLSFSPKGRLLVSGGRDKTLRVHSTLTGSVSAQAQLPSEALSVTLTSDAKRIVAGCADHVIRIWELTSEHDALNLTKELKGHEGPVIALAALLSPPHQLVSGSADGRALLWNLETGEVIREYKHGEPITTLAVRPDGKRLVSAGQDKAARLWHLSDTNLVAELKGNRFDQEALSESEQSLALAKSEAGYRQDTLKAAETELKSQADRITKAAEAFASAEKTFAEKQAQVKSATEAKEGAEKDLENFNAELKKVTDEFQAAEAAAQHAAKAAKEATQLALQSKQPAEEAKEINVLMEKIALDLQLAAAQTKHAAAREDSGKADAEKRASAAAALAETALQLSAQLNHVAEAKAKRAAESQATLEQAIDKVSATALALGQFKPVYEKLNSEAPERKKKAEEKIASAKKSLESAQDEFQKAELARSTSENELQLGKSAHAQAEAAVTAAKEALQAASENLKQSETAIERAKAQAAASIQIIRAAAFSSDNLMLATAGDDAKVHTWSAESGQAIDVLDGHSRPIRELLFAAPNELLSIAADQEVLRRDLHQPWALERVLGTGDHSSPLSDRVNSVRFAPEGNRLATGSGEPTRSGEILLWKISDGTVLQRFDNVHSDVVLALDFAPNGKNLASGAADRFVRVLDLESGQLVKSFEGHTHHVLGVSWKRDGRTLASAGADNVIKVWDLITGERKKNIEGFNKEVTSISFLGITDQAAVCSGDSQVRIVKENGDKVRSLEGVNDFTHAIASTADGSIVVAGGQDSVLRAWSGMDGKLIATFEPPDPGAKLASTSESAAPAQNEGAR